jgi:hypothetical protein
MDGELQWAYGDFKSHGGILCVSTRYQTAGRILQRVAAYRYVPPGQLEPEAWLILTPHAVLPANRLVAVQPQRRSGGSVGLPTRRRTPRSGSRLECTIYCPDENEVLKKIAEQTSNLLAFRCVRLTFPERWEIWQAEGRSCRRRKPCMLDGE